MIRMARAAAMCCLWLWMSGAAAAEVPAVGSVAPDFALLIDPQGGIARAYLKVDTSRHSGEIIEDLQRLAGK